MQEKRDIVLFFFIVCFIVSVGLFAKNHFVNKKRDALVSSLNKELMKSNLAIGKAETKFGDASTYINELEEKVIKDIKDKKSLVTKYGKLEAKYKSLSNKKVNVKVKLVEVIKLTDCKDLKLKENHLYVVKNKELGEINSLEGRYTDHHIDINCRANPRINSTGSLSMDISYNLELDLKAELVEAIAPSGAINNYMNIYEVDKDGKEMEQLTISSYVIVVEDNRVPSFYLWNPRVDIGLILGVSTKTSLDSIGLDGGASVGISTSSYGLTRKDPEWLFGRFSVDIGKEVSIGFTPLLYNVGKDLPLFNNLWIGGFGNYGLNSKDKRIGLLLGAGL